MGELQPLLVVPEGTFSEPVLVSLMGTGSLGIIGDSIADVVKMIPDSRARRVADACFDEVLPRPGRRACDRGHCQDKAILG